MHWYPLLNEPSLLAEHWPMYCHMWWHSPPTHGNHFQHLLFHSQGNRSSESLGHLLKVTQQESEPRAGLASLQSPSVSHISGALGPCWALVWVTQQGSEDCVPCLEPHPSHSRTLFLYPSVHPTWFREKCGAEQEHPRKACCGHGGGGWRRWSMTIYFPSSS